VTRLTPAVLLILATVVTAAAQTPPSGLQGGIDALSSFDYPTRMNAARALRRMDPGDVVPALMAAVRGHDDEFVRYRALVLLTAFNDRSTMDLMSSLIADRNDRIREVVYKWLERRPDPLLTERLLSALNTEQAEFVRPALIRALAASGREGQVQRALLAELGRGLDFFRSAVIETLGDHRAAYAIDALSAVAVTEGPLQDDAILALGRIGDRRALAPMSTLTNPPLEVIPALQAALCLLEDACALRLTVLVETARSRAASSEASRAAVTALGAVAASGHEAATDALIGLGDRPPDRLRDAVAITWSAVALRNPGHAIASIERAPDETRPDVIELLREGFESLEEDFAEEQFFAEARATYWRSAEGSLTRTVAADVIDRLEF
jgi:HEAT repeat protein